MAPRFRILVVDDNSTVRLHISRQLQRYDYDVETAAHGQEALDLLKVQAFDLVLLDVIMPQLDGYQVLTQLKADPSLRGIPVIMISASDDLEQAIRCIEKGAEDYLTKPLNQVVLRARLNASLERKSLRDQEQAYLKQLQAEKTAAEASHRAKSSFLANMSHELRTPLNAIIGYSEMLHEDLEAEGNLEYLADLEKIQTAGKQLLHLINNVLDLSKIEAGKMEYHPERIEISDFIPQIVAEIQPSLSEKGNSLCVEYTSLSNFLYADPSKVHQILLNLLNNANKFMESGTITLTIEESSRLDYFNIANANTMKNTMNTAPTPDLDRSPPTWMFIKVSDTGIGMTPEQIEPIFQAFNQADTSTTRKHDGAGLGLTIARRLCHLMGGGIQVHSQVNQGSTFTLWLPTRPKSHRLEFEQPESDPSEFNQPDPSTLQGC